MTVYWSRPPTEAERRLAQSRYADALGVDVVAGELHPLAAYYRRRQPLDAPPFMQAN